MADTQQNTAANRIASLLATARDQVDAGQYHEALAAVRDAKKLSPRNIYVLAFERQIEQLTELSAAGKLGEEERADIVESIPGIMDRALDGSGEQALPASPPPDAAAADRARVERTAAHEWLKNQYFQHAHEYVKKGEYDHAIAEIRRVFIIDPENKIARDFELQIDELSRIRRESEVTQPVPAKIGTRPAATPTAPATGDREPVPAKPGTSQTVEPSPAGKKGMRPLSIILLFLALALLAFATVYLIKKLDAPQAPSPRPAISAPQRELFTPERTAPPADTTRIQPDTSSAE